MHANYCDEDTWESRLGIIRYDKQNKSDPYTPPVSEQHYGFGCEDPAPTDLVPIVPQQVGKKVNDLEPADYLKIGLQGYPNASDPDSRIHKWVLANRTMSIDWEAPSLKKMTLDKKPEFPSKSSPIILDYEDGEWVYVLIINNYTLSATDTPRSIPRSVHPIHLHGHDFVVLAQGLGEFTPDVVPHLDNPARRDVANCPIGGYLWIAFEVNNPGPWLLHCHIAWHASGGLALQYLEQPKKIKPLIERAGALPELRGRCDEWSEYYATLNRTEGSLDESGV